MKFAGILCAALALVTLALPQAQAQGLTPEMKAKVQARLDKLKALGSEAAVVAAVKANNANPPAAAKAMTNEKWKSLPLLDPFVRSYAKNPLAETLKARKDDSIGEMFVSGADGTKVAYLSKTTSWSHKGKEKHDAPMAGRTWIGPVEVDESTGFQMVQVSFPVLDAGRPIGSMVVGLKVAALK